MALLRRFRVNAALTIQLFSQLFHYINMWLFNRVLGTAESNLCSRPYGDRLKAALLEIEAWAEKQGLELAAECHLSRIAQTAQFLQAPKAGRSAEELTALVDKFYKLNSLQLRALFERYQPTGAEELANAAFVRLLRDPALIEAVVKQARVATDELILKEGREVRLEEEIDLQLPFLLPEDGYSCDIVVGIPATLADFVQSLVAARVAKLTVQPTASGYWTIYFINFMPEVAAQAAAAHHQHQQNPHHHHQAMNSQETSTQSSSGTVTTTSTSGHFSGGDQSSGGSGGGGSVGSKSSTLVATPLAGPGYPLATSASAGQLMLNGQFRPAPGMSPLPSPQRSISGMVPGSPGFGAMPPPHAAMFNSFNGMRAMPEPEVQIIKLQKINNGIGLSIVAAQGTHQPVQGIYIKSVVKDGAADLDGRLKAGDQLLKVDGHSLIGIDQENAAKLMTNTGPVVTLEVAKQGAVFHGLSGLLKEQSASTTSLLKQATMRPRFANVPNASQAAADQYGAIRAMSNQNLMGHPRMGMTLPGGPNFNPGAYNTLPMGSSSSSLYSQQQMQQQAGLARGGPGGPQMLGHNSSSHSSLLLQHHHQQQQQQLLLQQQQQLPMRSDSQLSFNSKPGGGGLYEERHYQNIQLYQLNPRTGSPIGPGGPVAGNPAAARLAQMGPPLHHGSHSSLQPPQGYDQSMVSSAAPSQLTSVMGRPVSALVTSREQEQMPIFGNQQQQANYGQLQSPRGNSAAATSLEVRQRDLMRQEAKMEEIREELRRREDRGPNGNNNSNAAISRQVLGASSSLASTSSSQVRPSMMASSSTSSGTLLRTSGLQQQQQYPSAGNRLGSGSSGGGQPPAPAPKPNRPASAAFSSSGSLQQQQQPGSLSSSSSSQQLPMATQVSYRYGPSGYPQSSATASNNNNSTTTTTKSMQSSSAATLALGRTSGGKTSPSPWEREEKEKEQALKNEDSRERSREEEIRHLESLPYRNPKNEDRLRALLTERDFQRRAAEEAAKNGGDDYYGEGEYEDEEATARMLDRAEKRERMIALQADIERTRQRRLEGRYGGGNDLMEARAGSDGKLNKTLEEQEERLKMLRLEEEAAQQAEERLLQEAAKRRQDDESVPNHHHRAPPLVSKGILKSSGSVFNNNNNLDNDLPPPLPNSPPPVESANQRLDRLLLSTAHSKSASDDSTQLPPLTMVAPRGGVLKNGTAYNGSGGGSGGNHDQSSSNSSSNAAPKKVSWNTKTTVVVTPEDGEDDEEDDEDEGDRSDNDEQEGNRQHRRVENTTNKNNNNNNEEEDDDEEFYGGNGGAQNNGLGNGRGGGGGGDDLEETFSLQDIEEALVIGGDGSQGGQGNQTGGANTSSSGSAAQDDTTAGDMLTANSYDEEWHTKYVSSGHTSGVIGTQEIYNDPRQRIEAARRLAATNASQSALAGDKVPEKLSFAEKMKMFAKTSGAAAEDENNQINSGRGGPGGVTVSGTGKGAAAAASSNNSKSSSSVNQRTTVVTTNGGER